MVVASWYKQQYESIFLCLRREAEVQESNQAKYSAQKDRTLR